jgi:hypothetical protein
MGLRSKYMRLSKRHLFRLEKEIKEGKKIVLKGKYI